MNRKLLWPVLVIGLGLVIAPLAMSLPAKANAGERMMGDFQPIMQPNQVATTVDYYDDVFTKLRPVALAFNKDTVARLQAYERGLTGFQKESSTFIPALATQLGMTPEQVQVYMAREFPAMMQLFQALPQMGTDFSNMVGLMEQNVGVFERVPAGLDHYEPLVHTMQGNVDDYESVSSLPNFRLFTWFFIVPGLLLVGIAGYGLYATRAPSEVEARHARPTPA
jgi:hypothetical protein